MRIAPVWFLLLSLQMLPLAAQTVPTFRYSTGTNSFTLVGRGPAQGGTTQIPVVVVPVSLSFRAGTLDATPDAAKLLRSPVIRPFTFGDGGPAQFADAMLRATFPKHSDWHTILTASEVTRTVSIDIPASDGYLLTSKKTGGSSAVLDIEYVQKELFKQIGKRPGKLVIVLTRNATYYTEGDATLCCSWGTHGTDSATGNSFVLASYLDAAPKMVEDRDVQPVTEQLAELIYDPLHDPLVHQTEKRKPGNQFPPWMRPATMKRDDEGSCGGNGVSTPYFLLEPTDINHKNNVPQSNPFPARAGESSYHVQNVALLRWYLGAGKDLGEANSFPDAQALPAPAKPCPVRNRNWRTEGAPKPTVAAAPQKEQPNGHQLVGYWTGYGSALAAREISPQWDVIIAAFASPDHSAPEGTLAFGKQPGFDAARFKADVAYLKDQRKKVMVSLGGGGEYFSLMNKDSLSNFVGSVTKIVSEYGFDGVDIDFESPSLVLDSGDTDFRHPTTPSIVNLIAGLEQLRDHFGQGFMISLVPEGPQVPAGYRTYGGQFGSYLPLAYGIRNILSFMDVQDYNTPPLEGLDGEIYQAGTVDYHAAVTELVLHGFDVAGDATQRFPELAEDKVAVGFLVGETTPDVVSQAMNYLITGKAPAATKYKLRQHGGYGGMIGAMFWTIDGDRRDNYAFSNVVGPQLHAYKPKEE